MANTENKNQSSQRISGNWLARDWDSWVVDVPCPGGGGSGRFSFKEYGGIERALRAARAFQAEAIALLEKDREYMKKHGEKPPRRHALNRRNRTGITGVHREVHPNANSTPRIAWTATWMDDRNIQRSETFTTAQHPDESVCKRLAIAKREEMLKKFKRRK